MGLTMIERKPIYREMAQEYQKARKKAKKEILDRFMLTTGLNRNYATRLLRNHGKQLRTGKKSYVRADILKKGKRPGRTRYYDSEVVKLLKFIWKLSGFLCGKRLKPTLNEMIDNLLKNEHIEALPETIDKLRKISASSIDRLMKPERNKMDLKGRSGTKPGTLLKHQIAVRTWADWDENIPGFMEIDLVGHEGGNSRGDFSQTLDMVDVYSGWTETFAVKNKASLWVKEGIEKVKEQLPFPLLGLDSDTGGEFINDILYRFCEKGDIKFTRGRSSRSNDNCYVEQKNYSVVRKTVGYVRYDTDEEVNILNELYQSLRLYTNHFLPVMKMTYRERIGSKVRKKHNSVKTPYQRLMEHTSIAARRKENLKKVHEGLDLYELRKKISQCQKKLWNIHKKKCVPS
jgi:hypothetical protein